MLDFSLKVEVRKGVGIVVQILYPRTDDRPEKPNIELQKEFEERIAEKEARSNPPTVEDEEPEIEE